MTKFTIIHRLDPTLVLYLGEVNHDTGQRVWPDYMQRIWTNDPRGAVHTTWDAAHQLLAELRRLPEFADQVLEIVRVAP
jgi:hypothetical protein